MSDFLTNLNKIKNQLVQKNPTAMDCIAGNGIKVRDIFVSLEKLSNNQFKTLADMHKACSFNQQNNVYVGVSLMLEKMGTPVSSVSQGHKKKLEGTQLIIDFLKDNGLELPKKSVKTETETETESVATTPVEEVASV